MPRGNAFRDPGKLEEMLSYRKAGYSYYKLAEYYNVDHTSIIYHCQRAGIAKQLTDEEKKMVLKMVREGKKIEQVAKKFGILPTVVSVFCSKAGIKKKIISTTQKLPELVLKIPLPKVRKKRKIETEKRLYKKTIRHPRIGWIQNTDGTWRNAGKPQEQIKREQEKRNKEEDAKKKINMLLY